MAAFEVFQYVLDSRIKQNSLLLCHDIMVSTVSRSHGIHGVYGAKIQRCLRCHAVYGIKVSTVSRCRRYQGVKVSTVLRCPRFHGGYGVMASQCQGVYSVTVLKRHGVYGVSKSTVLRCLREVSVIATQNYSYCIITEFIIMIEELLKYGYNKLYFE